MAIQEVNSNLQTDINGTYHIKSINDHDMSETELTLIFDKNDQKISGFSGCNRFTGNYTLDKNSIKVGPLASTKKMCPEANNSFETEMLDALSKANNIRFHNDTLELLKDKEVLITAIRNLENLSPIFTYTAQSRGTFLELIVNESTISVTKDKGSQLVSRSCKESEWNKLIGTIKEVNLDSLSLFKAPTDARFYDGAAIAKLQIELGDKIYQSAPFDHGNPPLEIEPLVKEILSISENVE